MHQTGEIVVLHYSNGIITWRFLIVMTIQVIYLNCHDDWTWIFGFGLDWIGQLETLVTIFQSKKSNQILFQAKVDLEIVLVSVKKTSTGVI